MEIFELNDRVIFRHKDKNGISHVWREGAITHVTKRINEINTLKDHIVLYDIGFVVDNIPTFTTLTKRNLEDIEVIKYTENNKWLIGTSHFYYDRKIDFKNKELVLIANDYFDDENNLDMRNDCNCWIIAAFCCYVDGDTDDPELTPDDLPKQCYNVYSDAGNESEIYYDFCIPYKGNEHLLGEQIQKEHLINYVK